MPVRWSAAWLLIALSGIGCSSPALHADAGRDGLTGAAGTGAVGGHGGTVGGAAGAGTGGAGGSPGTAGGSSAEVDGGTPAGTDANDGGAPAGTDARDADAAGTDARDADAAGTDANDGGAPTATDAHDGGDLLCGGMTLFGLTVGDSCFDVVSVAPGANDGCKLGVADASPNGLVGAALPFNYDLWTATVSIGSMGALGAGEVLCNMGTLTREVTESLDSQPPCTWHQTDTSFLHMTGTNELDVSVTEVESTFAGCSAINTPTGGQCTSTWTWHLKRGVKAPPACE